MLRRSNTLLTETDSLKNSPGQEFGQDPYDGHMYWIAATKASEHIRRRFSSISEAFAKRNIPPSAYCIQAGFDEELLTQDVCYLEQIHIFVAVDVKESSDLLSELGMLCSPLSSILFADAHCYNLPIFDGNRTILEFQELVSRTTGTSMAAAEATTETDSFTPISCCSSAEFKSSGNDHGKTNRDDPSNVRRSKRGDDDSDSEDAGDDHDSESPEHPREDPLGNTTGESPEITTFSFEIVFSIYLTDDLTQGPAQEISGEMTIEVLLVFISRFALD